MISSFLFSCLYRGDDWTLLKTQEELDLSSLSLGELLKRKAEEGVRVLVMIWGETTAIMGTHDTETENYFKGKQTSCNLGLSTYLLVGLRQPCNYFRLPFVHYTKGGGEVPLMTRATFFFLLSLKRKHSGLLLLGLLSK